MENYHEVSHTSGTPLQSSLQISIFKSSPDISSHVLHCIMWALCCWHLHSPFCAPFWCCFWFCYDQTHLSPSAWTAYLACKWRWRVKVVETTLLYLFCWIEQLVNEIFLLGKVVEGVRYLVSPFLFTKNAQNDRNYKPLSGSTWHNSCWPFLGL